jgi:hypothetical protein
MNDQKLKLGKLEAVYGISPVYLQRALVVIVLSFVFFLIMLIAFSLRQNIGYFILATAFLIVKLFTLFGWMMQRKKTVVLYQNGLALGKKICRFDEIERIGLKETGKMPGGEKIEGEIVTTKGEKIVLPGAIHNIRDMIRRIEEKIESETALS